MLTFSDQNIAAEKFSGSTPRLTRGLRWMVAALAMTMASVRCATPRLPDPTQTAKTFDSLMEAGRYPEAKRLTTGGLLRMFDFMAMAQEKMSGLLDTGKSRDQTLEEKQSGDWAYLKVLSVAVFKRPFLGQDSLRSIQATHLYHSRRGWLLAEVEELPDSAAPVRLRSGIPDTAEPIAQGPVTHPAPVAVSPSLFPVSPKAPEAGQADRLRYRLTLRQGSRLSDFCPIGPTQSRVQEENPRQWILENRRPVLASSPQGRSIAINPAQRPAAIDTVRFAPFLSSNPYLDLRDTLLQKKAAELSSGETDPVKVTQKIYAWVTGHFNFQLGAVLFGKSGEVLRGMRGDCSEAAILTAALLRARRIPTRVALGFASVGRGVFIGHAWCEAYLQGQWVGVDAALREFPAGVERVKLIELDGSQDMRISATNLMLAVLSNLDIEILAAWKGGKSLPLQTYAGNGAEAAKFFQDILKGMSAK